MWVKGSLTWSVTSQWAVRFPQLFHKGIDLTSVNFLWFSFCLFHLFNFLWIHFSFSSIEYVSWRIRFNINIYDFIELLLQCHSYKFFCFVLFFSVHHFFFNFFFDFISNSINSLIVELFHQKKFCWLIQLSSILTHSWFRNKTKTKNHNPHKNDYISYQSCP